MDTHSPSGSSAAADSPPPSGIRQQIGRQISRLTPSLSVDEEGKPQLTLGMSRTVPVKESLEEVLRAGESGGRNLQARNRRL